MSTSNIGSVDLESVLAVRRRTLPSIGESRSPRLHHHYSDTIYLKRKYDVNSLFSIDSEIVIFGELQLLCSIFERYTSSINVYEEPAAELNPPLSTKPRFSVTLEEDELAEEGPPIVSTLRKTSITTSTKGTVDSPYTTSNPTRTSGSPTRKKTLGMIGRAQTIASPPSDYSSKNLEGKRYGCIQIPNMTIIEILELLLRSGLELVDVSSDYDQESVLHQNFVLSKSQSVPQKFGYTLTRSASVAGT